MSTQAQICKQGVSAALYNIGLGNIALTVLTWIVLLCHCVLLIPMGTKLDPCGGASLLIVYCTEAMLHAVDSDAQTKIYPLHLHLPPAQNHLPRTRTTAGRDCVTSIR